MPCNVHYYTYSFFGGAVKKKGCVSSKSWRGRKITGGNSDGVTERDYTNLEECKTDVLLGSDIFSRHFAVTFDNGYCSTWKKYN